MLTPQEIQDQVQKSKLAIGARIFKTPSGDTTFEKPTIVLITLEDLEGLPDEVTAEVANGSVEFTSAAAFADFPADKLLVCSKLYLSDDTAALAVVDDMPGLRDTTIDDRVLGLSGFYQALISPQIRKIILTALKARKSSYQKRIGELLGKVDPDVMESDPDGSVTYRQPVEAPIEAADIPEEAADAPEEAADTLRQTMFERFFQNLCHLLYLHATVRVAKDSPPPAQAPDGQRLEFEDWVARYPEKAEALQEVVDEFISDTVVPLLRDSQVGDTTPEEAADEKVAQ
jgi:hypothetical protein